jgi:hypothetical protein
VGESIAAWLQYAVRNTQFDRLDATLRHSLQSAALARELRPAAQCGAQCAAHAGARPTATARTQAAASGHAGNTTVSHHNDGDTF